MRRGFASAVQISTLVLLVDWTTGAMIRSGQVGPGTLWLAAGTGFIVYLAAAILLLAAGHLGATLLARVLPIAIDRAAVARGAALFVLVFVALHELDGDVGLQIAWIPVAALFVVGFHRWSPPAPTILAIGVLAVSLVVLVTTAVPPGTLATQLGGIVASVIAVLATWSLALRSPPQRRVHRIVLATAVALTAVGLALPYRPGRSDRPPSGSALAHNLLLITIDTLRADAVSPGPDTRTPSIAGAAARGAAFSRAYSAGPWTQPSMAALFSSKHPLELRTGPYTYFAGDGPLLVRRVAETGAETCAVVANPVVEALTHGFRSVRTIRPFATPDPLWLLPVLHTLRIKATTRLGFLPFQDSTTLAADATIDCLRRVGQERFFAWVHFFDPHDPYAPPPQWRLPEARASRSYFAPHLKEAGHESIEDLQAGRTFGLDPGFWNSLRKLYAGEVRHTDAAVGRILAALDELGLAEDTLVVITSDHGEEFQDHGSYYHGQSLYDELVRVPLILLGPGIAPRRIDRPVSLLDVMPTLSELLGLPPDPEAEGRSVTPLLGGNADDVDPWPIVLEGTNYGEPRRGIILGRYKLITGTLTGRVELYDLEADPAERSDISSQHPDLVATLLSHLPPPDSGRPPPRRRPEEEAQALERLRSLGYIR